MNSTDLNLHARNAITRVVAVLRSDLVRYWRGDVPSSVPAASTKALRAQARATAQIAPAEAEALQGIAALTEVAIVRAEAAYRDGDVPRSDAYVHGAMDALKFGRDTILGEVR